MSALRRYSRGPRTLARLSGIAMFSDASSPRSVSVASMKASFRSPSIFWLWRKRTWPTLVSTIGRMVRSNSCRPIVSSSPAMICDTPDWVRPSILAAWVMLPCSAVIAKTSSARNSKLPGSIPLVTRTGPCRAGRAGTTERRRTLSLAQLIPAGIAVNPCDQWRCRPGAPSATTRASMPWFGRCRSRSSRSRAETNAITLRPANMLSIAA